MTDNSINVVAVIMSFFATDHPLIDSHSGSNRHNQGVDEEEF